MVFYPYKFFGKLSVLRKPSVYRRPVKVHSHLSIDDLWKTYERYSKHGRSVEGLLSIHELWMDFVYSGRYFIHEDLLEIYYP